MLVPQLITQLLAASQHHASAAALQDVNASAKSGEEALSVSSSHDPVLSPDKTLAVALCRMGTDTELIVSGTLGELLALASPSVDQARADEEADEADDELASEAQLDERRAQRAAARAVAAYGPPLHSLVLVGKRLHHLERDYAGMYKVPGSRWDEVARDVYGVTIE